MAKTIKFAAKPWTKAGDVVRAPRPEAKFWLVIKVQEGIAVARPAGGGTDPRIACC